MKPTRKSLLLWIILLCCPRLCKPQAMQIDSITDGNGNYWMKWDHVQHRLIAYRDASDASVPAAQLYGKDGHNLPIYPVKDLAESYYLNIFDAAATPDGGMVVAAFVGYGPAGSHPPIKSVLLTYGAAGDLKKVWDVSPYEFDLVAVDAQGNVYALGDADLEEPYFLLVKYSPDGKVLHQFLSTSLFSVGDHILSPGGGTKGLNQMFIEADVLFVWLARTQELLRFSLSGEMLGRISLARPLSQLAAAGGNDGVQVRSLAAGEGDQMIAQVLVWDTTGLGTSGKLLLIHLSLDGSSAEPLPITQDRIQFLGRSSTGKLMVMDPSSRTVKEY